LLENDLQSSGRRAEDRGLSGSVALDNKTLFIAESDKGYDIGTMISLDEMELAYLEDGKNLTAAIDHLNRES
jgi:hypothetical protein